MKGKFVLTIMIAVLSAVFMVSSIHAQTVRAYMGLSPENNVKVVDFVKAKTGIQILLEAFSF